MKRLLASIFLRLARALGVTEMQSRLDEVLVGMSRVGEQQDALSRFYEHRFEELLDHVDFLTKERDEEILVQLRRHVTDLRRSIDKGVTTVRTDRDDTPARSGGARSREDAPVIDDVLYINLEDRFRGNPADIRERQKQYLPYVGDIVDTDHPLVDIGFGRGEWLDLLKESGVPARGIDSNEVSVLEAGQRGLDVSTADLLDFLRTVPEGSLGAITMFQVMEHLPFDVLVETFRLCSGALKRGGVLIAEVPNSETLTVGASTFWIDPTHQRPVFPAVLRFLASETGFSKVDGVYSTPLAPRPELATIADPDRSALLKLHDAVLGAADFALIATV